MIQSKTVDIAIMGAGIVGLSLAHLLSKQLAVRVMLIDKKKIQAPKLSKSYTSRVSALNHFSQRLFEQLGLWDAMAERSQAYFHMHVWSSVLGEIDLDVAEAKADTLGVMLENAVMEKSLIDALPDTGVEVVDDWSAKDIICEPDQAIIRGEDGSLIKARWLVAADGALSWVKETLGAAQYRSSYEHVAVVSNVTTERSHQQTAWQRFLDTGPLAFLPLPDPHQCSIVWSTSAREAEYLMSLKDKAFCESIGEAFEYVLGEVAACSKRLSFPLVMRHVKSYLHGPVVFVGDAAHTIHPLAGQGLNLGLQDAVLLTEAFRQASFEDSTGQHRCLRQFERACKAKNWQMIMAMGFLKRFYAIKQPTLQGLAGSVLGTIQDKPFLKKQFIKMAEGGAVDIPSWL